MPLITSFSDAYHIFYFSNNLLQPDISVADLTSNLVYQILILQFCCRHGLDVRIHMRTIFLKIYCSCHWSCHSNQRVHFCCSTHNVSASSGFLSSIFGNIFVISNLSLYLIHGCKLLLFCFPCLFYIRFIRLLFNQFAPDSTH